MSVSGFYFILIVCLISKVTSINNGTTEKHDHTTYENMSAFIEIVTEFVPENQQYTVTDRSTDVLTTEESFSNISYLDLNQILECYVEENAADYRGAKTTTVKGKTCQNWLLHTPHSHTYHVERYSNEGLGDHNLCRNPDPVEATWCFTTDPDTRWDWCDVGKPQESCVCATTFSGREGHITSPLYPHDYPKTFDCLWTVQVPDKNVVEVSFRFVDAETELDCSFDYLVFYLDGLRNSLRFCGKNSHLVYSEGATLLIKFFTNDYYTSRGFNLTWKAVSYELLSKGKPTRQSSAHVTYIKYTSELAVDGRYSLFFDDDSCCHTYEEFEPWWRVDLTKAYAVQFIYIVNRLSLSERLKDAEVHVGMSPNPYRVNPQCGPVFSNAIATSLYIKIDCHKPMHGRYVSIFIANRLGILTLCEVQVYGFDTDPMSSRGNSTEDKCSYSPGPCDDPATNCSFPSATWPSCTCNSSMFVCDNGRCIPMTYRCNTYDNCGDGSDEYSCVCSVNDIVCIKSRDSICLNSGFLCDGFDDCDDSTDELNCNCTADQYQCTDDGRCLDPEKLCNNVPDCTDGQEELPCVFCNDGTEVPFSQHCDGKFDCPNRKDERNCAYCPNDYELFEGSCYHFNLDEDLDFYDVQEYCKGQSKGYVVVVDSEDENVFITQSIVDLTSGLFAWLGITNMNEEDVWTSEVPVFTSYTNWNPGQPVDHLYYDEEENCAHLQVEQVENERGGWNAISCSYSLNHRAVCEFQPVRLVGGDSLIEGFVEVYNDGLWGTICGDDWGKTEADVVCNQLNLPYSDPVNCCDARAQNDTRRLYDQVFCTGDEFSLSYCSLKVEKGNCLSDLDVWIRCTKDGIRLVGGSSADNGFVEVFKYGEWGSVCDVSPTSFEAFLICKELGYSGAVDVTNTESSSSSGTGKPINIADPDCGGSETSIFQCTTASNVETACLHKNDLFVTCRTECVEETIVDTRNVSVFCGNITIDAVMEPCTIIRWNIQNVENFIDISISELTTGTNDNQYCNSYLVIEEDFSKVGPICDDIRPFVRSVSSDVLIMLGAGYKRQYLHFAAVYRQAEIPGCYVTTYGSRFDCLHSSAILATPNYPQHYTHGSRFTWHIEIPSSSSYISLTFLDFDIPSDELCQSDNVIIYNGDVSSDDIVGRFCNYEKPPRDVLSIRNKMTLVFSSDGSGSGTGFQAIYTERFLGSINDNLNSSFCWPWDFYENACYHSFSQSTKITWTEAKKECEKLGSHLVFINSKQEMEFIHYMLTHSWSTEETDVYIGLSHRTSDNGVYYWSNDSPLSYTAWYRAESKENVRLNEPKAGDLEQCTLIRLENFYSLQQWREVACEFPTTTQYICKYMLENFISNTTLHLGEVEMFSKECYSDDFRCDNLECTHGIFVCDGKRDCRDGSDEKDCKDVCDQGGFVCGDGQCISSSFVCDFHFHCSDMSDENNCYYRNCTSEEFRCDNGLCVSLDERCDLLQQCDDGSDERDCDVCSSGFQCYDGSCLPARALCDATNDCPGDIVEDEINCDYWKNRTCLTDEITCKNGECSPKRYQCIFDSDEYHIQKGCRDMTHLDECLNFKCPDNTLKCPASYCIVERLRCNGVWDCQNGEDEVHCDSYLCPNLYRCTGSTICVSRHERCNGVIDCPKGDDELFCDYFCPLGCSCRGLEIKCSAIEWNYATVTNISTATRYLNLTGLKTTKVTKRSTSEMTIQDTLFIDISQFHLLIIADFSSNGIEKVSVNTFTNQLNLRKLVLSKNNITHLQYGSFNGLRSLETLFLDSNGLTSINSGVFAVLSNLQYLYLQENVLKTFQEDVFDGLDKLKLLSSDDFLFCCIVGNIERCDPPPDQFSSCEDLMKNSFLRVLMWILGISALIGNIFVIIWRLYEKDYRSVQSLLVTNLAASDFLMGFYMIIIAGADMHYRGRYARFADDWKSSFLCSFAGSISTLSSEFSVFILVVMSLDRAVAVAFPFSTTRLNQKKCLYLLAIAWLIITIIAFLPVLNIPYFGERYYGRPSVCLALPLTGDRVDGWEFSIAIFLGFNLFGFIIIAITYIYIYISVKRTASSVRKNQVKSNDLKMATKMAIIVFTDFCCWFPIILMGIASQVGAWQIPAEIYVWSATLIMPINSSINPYLFTIPYISDVRKKRRMRLTKSTQLQYENKGSEVTLSEKVSQDVERNRILPMLNVATSRPYLLSSLMAAHKKKNRANNTKERLFCNEELAQIENDLKKALQFLHRNDLVHSSITNDFVVIHTDKGCKRAFLIGAPTATIETTEGDVQEQNFNQLKKLMNGLRQTKK